jgi:hypothetical protein
MYRFLDKRFYHRQRLEFDLRTFACEHVGLSKNYHNGELKRVLAPAIAELEGQGFLKKLSSEERFIRQGRGEWTAIFVREGKQTAQIAEKPSELAQALIERGVNAQSASFVLSRFDEAKIREKIAFFDWLSAKQDARVQRSPAGFLYRAITEDFALPEDYLAASAAKPRPQERKVIPLQRHTARKDEGAKQPSDRNAIDQFWNSLDADEQGRIELELVASAPRFLREQYLEGQKDRGLLFQAVRQAMIDEHVRKTLTQFPAVSLA